MGRIVKLDLDEMNETEIADALLELLIATNNGIVRAGVQRESSDPAHDGTHGMIRKALVRHLRLVAQWPEAMAEEAISHALVEGCGMREAMFACQTG